MWSLPAILRRPAAPLALLLLASAPTRAEVISVTVGVQPSCPYGLGA